MKEKKKQNTYGFLYQQAEDKKFYYLFSLITAIISVASGLVPYFLVIKLVENLFLGVKDFSVYLDLAFLMLVFYLIKVIFHGISTTLSHGATFKVIANVRKRCCEKLAKMPLGDVLAIPKGTLKSTLMERIDQFEPTLAHMVPEFTSNLLAPFALVVMIFMINWKMGLASLVTLPIGMICMMSMTIGYEKWFNNVLRTTKNVNDMAIEYIKGIEVIKVFGKARSSYDRFVTCCKEASSAYIDWMKHSNIFFCLGFVIFPATMISILPIGAIMIHNGSLQLVEMVEIIILSIALIDPIINVLSFNDDLRQIDVVVGDVIKILDAKELKRPIELKEKIKDNSIKLDNVHFAYQEKEVLHGINMEIKPGSFIALVGPSGSGKSTIAKLISSMWDVKSGAIYVGGVDIRNIPLDDYQDKISYVSQDNYLFNESIKDNIRMGKTNGVASDEEVIEVAKLSGCYDFIMNLENGFDTIVGEGGGHLSGGERQRICIARAMLKNADIVILDEATAYADPENEAIIQDSVSKLVKGKTLIVIAHRLSTITSADKIYCINEGKVVEEGTHDELLEMNGLYKRMWDAHISVKDQVKEVK